MSHPLKNQQRICFIIYSLTKSGTIYLLDDSSVPITWWDFEDAFPTKWEGPSLSAKNNAIATERMTLVHQGLKRSETARLLSAFRTVIG